MSIAPSVDELPAVQRTNICIAFLGKGSSTRLRHRYFFYFGEQAILHLTICVTIVLKGNGTEDVNVCLLRFMLSFEYIKHKHIHARTHMDARTHKQRERERERKGGERNRERERMKILKQERYYSYRC